MCYLAYSNITSALLTSNFPFYSTFKVTTFPLTTKAEYL